MQGPDDLETLLDAPAGDTPAASEPQVAEPTAPEAEAQPEPTGEKQESAAPPADVKPEVKPEAEAWTKQAVLDERRKRQELEKQLKDLQEKLQPKPAEAKPPQAKADWWAEPDKAAEAMQAQIEQKVFQTRVAMSERLMKQQHADYDEVSNVFAERAKEDPNLMQQLFDHPFPAEFAYQAGLQIKLLNEIGQDPAAYRAKLRDELRAELLAETGQQPAQKPNSPAPKAPPAVPRSLARDVNAQPRQTNGRFASLDAPAPLDELLG